MASECRHALNCCDLPEYCDGKNPSCPADFFVQDGHPCPDGALEVIFFSKVFELIFIFSSRLFVIKEHVAGS